MRRGKLPVLSFIVSLSVAVIFFANSPANSQAKDKPIQLSFSNFWPPTFGLSVESVKWAEEIEKRTNGRVKITIHHGGTLTTGPNCYEGVLTGISDIGQAPLQYTRGRFPLMEALDIPGYPLNGIVTTRIANDIYNKFKPKELAGTHVLYLHMHLPGVFYTAKKPIKTLEDFKGLRFRGTGQAANLIAALGATPIPVTKNDEYEAMKKGVLDGTLGTPVSFISWKIGDIAKYATVVPKAGYVTAFFVVMNAKKWHSLPPDLQKVFTEVSYEWIERSGKAWNAVDTEGAQAAKKIGFNWIIPDAKEAARWEKVIEPIYHNYEKAMQAKGLPGKQVLEYRRQLIEKYAAVYQPLKWW